MSESTLTRNHWIDVSEMAYGLTAVLQTLEPMVGQVGVETTRYDYNLIHGLTMAANTLADRLHSLVTRMEEDNIYELLFDDRGESPGQVPELTLEQAQRIRELWTQA